MKSAVKLNQLRLGLLALALMIVVPAGAQEKVTLSHKAKEGQVARYQQKFNADIEAMGQKIKAEVTQTSKRTVTKVGADGTITYEEKDESSETKINGEKLPEDEPTNDTTTVTILPNGMLVKYTSSSDTGGDKLAVRLYNSTNIIFSEKAVGTGDKWSYEYKADADLGTVTATGNFEVLGFEKIGDVETVRIRMTYSETGSKPITSTSTQWIELASGDAVKSEFTFNNVPFGEGDMMVHASGKGTGERISGSPLASAAAGEEKAKEKTIDDEMKEAEKLPGLFTVYRKKEGGRTQTFLEIPEAELGKLYMLQATAATGTSSQVVAGNPINDIVFRFELNAEDRLMMISPNFLFRAAGDPEMTRSLERSFANSLLESFKVEARQPDRKSLLINVSDLFRGDIANFAANFSGGGGLPIPGLGGGGYSLDRENTFVNQLKVFPENIFVQTTYNFTKSGSQFDIEQLLNQTLPDPRSILVKLNYNMSKLPEGGYVPRLYDHRVGYFTADYQNFANSKKMDDRRQYILRWRLEKKDPNARVSEPVKPIVFWVDNAVPKPYRKAVRDGILAWNEAFEMIGFKNAVVVNQMPDDADWDHADMRYNVVRWVSSPGDAYAVALFRVNPLTGEILNAGITVDSNIVRYILDGEFRGLIDPAKYFEPRQHDPKSCRLGGCTHQSEAKLDASVGFLAASMLGNPITRDQYVNQFIEHVVAHEMGHILGLRHNFVASTELNLDELGSAGTVNARSTSASVMDYVPFNISALRNPGVKFYGGLGQYDKAAIEYGYKVTGAKTPDAEMAELRKLASRYNMPGMMYLSDEDADAFDPYTRRFDLGRNPLDYYRRVMGMSRSLALNLDKRLPQAGESYWSFTQDFRILVGQYARMAAMATTSIGGLRMNRNHKGDPGERPPLEPIPAAEQRAALRLVIDGIFAESAFTFPKHFYGKLTGNPNAGLIESFLAGPDSAPVRDQFSGIQRAALNSLFSLPTLQRVSNNEFKMGNSREAMTLLALFNGVGSAVWSELSGNRAIGPLRRDLQRRHLDLMIQMVVSPANGTPSDARTLAWDQLNSLRSRLAASERATRDAYTRAHLRESLARVVRALNAQQTIGGAAPQRSILEELLGGGRP